ncbi:adenosylcobinamide-GDP ribazoletransferase, partial [Actinomyces sp. oral taxon 178 str. F0338]
MAWVVPAMPAPMTATDRGVGMGCLLVVGDRFWGGWVVLGRVCGAVLRGSCWRPGALLRQAEFPIPRGADGPVSGGAPTVRFPGGAAARCADGPAPAS